MPSSEDAPPRPLYLHQTGRAKRVAILTAPGIKLEIVRDEEMPCVRSGADQILSGEHVHSCCVLDVILVETIPSRIMPGHYHDDSSVFLF